ncbi:YbaB/EbfC family nucleoid-associated protein [Williamsia sp. M5A3_1d]
MSDQNFPPRAPLPATAPMPPTFPITFDDLEASARRALDRMQSASEAIAGIRNEHTDDDERVTVVVSGTGELLDLRISDSAMSMDPDELARLVVSTAQAAAGQAFGSLGHQIQQLTETMANDPGVLAVLQDREAPRD